MTVALAIGIDLGGTDIKAGVVDGGLRVLAKTQRPTLAQRGPDAVIDEIVGMIEHLAKDHEIETVGVGTPGPLSPSRGIVFKSANLPGWQDVPLRDTLAKRTGRSIVVDNDANVAAYGEYRANPEVRDLVLLTIGTGVGAGTIVDGKILHGHHENASEWGHMIVNGDGPPCKCGQRGCLETYASATGMSARLAAAVAAGESSTLADGCRENGGVSAADLTAAARGGDALATRIWDESCRALATACVNLQHAVNPECILLGGGVSGAGDFLLDPVRRHFEALHWNLHSDAPRIDLAKLGNMAGVIGAAALALD